MKGLKDSIRVKQEPRALSGEGGDLRCCSMLFLFAFQQADAGWQAGAMQLAGAQRQAVAGRQAGPEQHQDPGTCGGANQKDRNRSRISRIMRNKVKVRI